MKHYLTPNQLAQMKNAVFPNVGEVWEDNDPRIPGRRFRIVAIESDEEGPKFAYVEAGERGIGRRTRIGLWRFNPNRRDGYTRIGFEEQA